MSAKVSAAKRAAFLRALSATGNQTLAAERAKVSRSWVILHRGRDAEFDAAVRGAVAEARERLSGTPDQVRGDERGTHDRGRTNRPPSGWAFVAGEEMVVRGTRSGPRGSPKRRVQIGRARLKQWTARGEQLFLEVLAATCNVKAACAAVGLTPASAYNHRDRWPGFARRWEETVDTAMTKIEIAMLQRAADMVTELEAPLDTPIREMTASEALYLLEMHKRRQAGDRRVPGRWRGPARIPIEEVKATILRRAEAIRRARGLRGGG